MVDSTIALIVAFSALGLFSLVAVRGAWRSGVATREPGPGGREAYLSARGTQSGRSTALTFFASALGAWILFSPPEIGTFGGLVAISGYAVGQAGAIAIFAWLGPAVRERLPAGTTILEFVSVRFGRPMQLWVGIVALGYMFVFLTAELTAVGLAFDALASTRVIPILAVAAVTAAYTAYGGLPASIWTDRWQAWLTLGLVAVGLGAIVSNVPSPLEHARAGGLFEVSRVGGETAVVLVIAVIAANLFHQGFWQRAWAARDRASLVRGALGGGALIVPLLLAVAATGMIAASAGTFDHPSNALFSLLGGLPAAVLILVAALVVTLVASTVDTLQNGLTSLVAVHTARGRMGLGWARVVTVALTIPAVVIAVQGLSVLRLFLIADLLAATIAVPVFLGLWRRATPFSALAGSLAGIGGIVAVGWVSDGSLADGLRLLTLPTGPDFGAFLVAPLASAAVSVIAILAVRNPKPAPAGV